MQLPYESNKIKKGEFNPPSITLSMGEILMSQDKINYSNEPPITRQQAIEIALQHIKNTYRGRLKIIEDRIPEIYYTVDPKECWYIHVESEIPRLGVSRIIAIHKKTGEIIDDSYEARE